MAVAIVIGPDGKERARHERDSAHRAWLSAHGAGSHVRQRRRGTVTVEDYPAGTTVRVHEDDEGPVVLHKRYDGRTWSDVVPEVSGG